MEEGGGSSEIHWEQAGLHIGEQRGKGLGCYKYERLNGHVNAITVVKKREFHLILGE